MARPGGGAQPGRIRNPPLAVRVAGVGAALDRLDALCVRLALLLLRRVEGGVVYGGAGSSHASDYNFGAGAMPGDPLALTSASHARAPAVPIPKLPKPPAPAPRRRGPPARGPPKQQDAVWRPPGSSNGGVAKLTAQLAAEDPFAAGNDPFASSGGTSPAFGGGAASVDPFAAVGLSSGDPFAGMGGATPAPMPSMGMPPPPPGSDPFAGMSAAPAPLLWLVVAVRRAGTNGAAAPHPPKFPSVMFNS